MTDPTHLFSTKVGNYTRYRPQYPAAVLKTLKEECQLENESVVADVGSGTGILTELFLENGNRVFAVEPNREMREAGEWLLRTYPGFHSVAGRAEATTLPDNSVDLVAAGQAFHWFDHERARAEFLRILKPLGWVMLVWNVRDSRSTPFLSAYQQLLQRYSSDYQRVSLQQISKDVFANFFGTEQFLTKKYPNHLECDYAAVEGRLLSTSYTPEAGHPNYNAMLGELSKIFQMNQADGRVRMEYVTTMYYGRLR